MKKIKVVVIQSTFGATEEVRKRIKMEGFSNFIAEGVPSSGESDFFIKVEEGQDVMILSANPFIEPDSFNNRFNNFKRWIQKTVKELDLSAKVNIISGFYIKDKDDFCRNHAKDFLEIYEKVGLSVIKEKKWTLPSEGSFIKSSATECCVFNK